MCGYDLILSSGLCSRSLCFLAMSEETIINLDDSDNEHLEQLTLAQKVASRLNLPDPNLFNGFPQRKQEDKSCKETVASPEEIYDLVDEERSYEVDYLCELKEIDNCSTALPNPACQIEDHVSTVNSGGSPDKNHNSSENRLHYDKVSLKVSTLENNNQAQCSGIFDSQNQPRGTLDQLPDIADEETTKEQSQGTPAGCTSFPFGSTMSSSAGSHCTYLSTTSQLSSVPTTLSQASSVSSSSKGKKRETAAEKEERKRQKQEAKRQLEEEKQKQKQMKALLKEQCKIFDPKECLKHIQVVIDPAVLKIPEATRLLERLCGAELDYCVENQPLQSIICWRRRTINAYSSSTQTEVFKKTEVELENVLLYFLELKMFLSAVFEHVRNSGTVLEPLLQAVSHVQSVFGKERSLNICVAGLEVYFCHVKTLQNRHHRGAVEEKFGVSPPKNNRAPKGLRNIDSHIIVSREDVDNSVLQTELALDVCFHFVEDSDQLCDLVAGFTKSVAEAPYKRAKKSDRDQCSSDQFAADFYYDGISKGTKVEKDGRGQAEVWRNMLSQMPWINREMANTIVQNYGSPGMLLEAMRKGGELMLQNLTIRRKAGIFETERRIGPEASKKLYQTLTAQSRDIVVGRPS